MKTNLIFKRQITIDNVTQVVTKIVPVNIPRINSGEGWILSGHTDLVEFAEEAPVNTPEPIKFTEVTDVPDDVVAAFSRLDNKESLSKFTSKVEGTAKLVRSKGVIKIAARRGKSTYNQTTPNSVCIDNVTRDNFFKDCNRVHAGTYCFGVSDGALYNYWNDVVEKEYARQKKQYGNY